MIKSTSLKVNKRERQEADNKA